MTFEEILPHLKNGKKIIRSGWGGFELYVFLEPTSTHKGSTL
ncbi:MAG: Thoeris anti-defense Tad2 family protein, partial [Carnobacterium maltaromaticum]